METGILPIADRATIATPQSLDSLAVGKPNFEGRTDLSSSRFPSSPDVQVHLSDLGRQLAIEAMEKETIQAAQASEEYQTERRLAQDSLQDRYLEDQYLEDLRDDDRINDARVEHDETLDLGTQEEARIENNQVAYDNDNNRIILEDIPDADRQIVEAKDRSDELVRERREADSEERYSEAVTQEAIAPVNTSRSASVVTQYNISPESALGQTVSTYA